MPGPSALNHSSASVAWYNSCRPVSADDQYSCRDGRHEPPSRYGVRSADISAKLSLVTSADVGLVMSVFPPPSTPQSKVPNNVASICIEPSAHSQVMSLNAAPGCIEPKADDFLVAVTDEPYVIARPTP